MKRNHLIIVLALLAMVIAPFLAGNAEAAYISDGSVQNGTTGLLGVATIYCVAPPSSWDGTTVDTVKYPHTYGIPPAVKVPGAYTDGIGMDDAICDAPPVVNNPAMDTTIAATLTTDASCTAAGYNWSYTQNGSSNPQPLIANGVTAAAATAGSCTAGFLSADIPVIPGTSSYEASHQPANGVTWFTYGNEGCMKCHHKGGSAHDKSSYLKGGHRNMLRKVTAGANWAGPDGTIYTTDGANAINFGTGTVTLAKDNSSHKLFYIYGDWLVPNPSLVYNTSSDGVTSNGYSCASCHTAGYANCQDTTGYCSNPAILVSSASYPTPYATVAAAQAACTAPNGKWLYATGVANGGAIGGATCTPGAQPLASFPGITGVTGTWDLDGIRCSRCHNSSAPALNDASGNIVTGDHNNNPKGIAVTNLCFGCHNSLNKGQTDPTQIPVTPKGALDSHGNAATANSISSHGITMQFLNSPHGKYTGTIVKN